jgi:hypothetical protein
MAHPNINERREAVMAIINTGYTNKDLKRIADKFQCSFSAVYADTIQIKYPDTLRHLSGKIRNRILERDNRTCQYCGLANNGEMIVEHVVSFSIGGGNQDYNLVCACQSCNVKKGNKIWLPLNIEVLRNLNAEWANTIKQKHRQVSRHYSR